MEGSSFSRLTEEAIGVLGEHGKGTCGRTLVWSQRAPKRAYNNDVRACPRCRDRRCCRRVSVWFACSPFPLPTTHPFLLMSSLWAGDDLLVEH
jgi:hypothetical protein